MDTKLPVQGTGALPGVMSPTRLGKARQETALSAGPNVRGGGALSNPENPSHPPIPTHHLRHQEITADRARQRERLNLQHAQMLIRQARAAAGAGDSAAARRAAGKAMDVVREMGQTTNRLARHARTPEEKEVAFEAVLVAMTLSDIADKVDAVAGRVKRLERIATFGPGLLAGPFPYKT